MKILFDARHIEDVYSGLARYTYSLLDALIRSDLYGRLDILVNTAQKQTANPLFAIIAERVNEKVNFVFLDAPLFRFKHHSRVSRYVNQSDCDIYFYPHFDLPIGIRKKSVFVVHDLLPLVIDNYIIRNKFFKQLYFRGVIKYNLNKRNVRCVAVSQSTKSDILKYIDSGKDAEIRVVYEGNFDLLIKSNTKNEHVEAALERRFLFYIGTRRPHKNLRKMIDSFEILKRKYNYDGYFVIAGSKNNYDFDVDGYVKDRDGVLAIGPVSDEELVELYKKMDALFFLTRYEGFGLPIVEAAKLNKRIITSTTSACAEIAPPSALLVDPDQHETLIAERVSAYIASEERIDNSEYLKGFSWEKSVAEIFS